MKSRKKPAPPANLEMICHCNTSGKFLNFSFISLTSQYYDFLVFQEHHSGCCNLVSAGSVLHLAFQDVIKDIFLSIDGLHKFLTVVSVENILCRLNLLLQ